LIAQVEQPAAARWVAAFFVHGCRRAYRWRGGRAVFVEYEKFKVPLTSFRQIYGKIVLEMY
jgi:hypothetical protein